MKLIMSHNIIVQNVFREGPEGENGNWDWPVFALGKCDSSQLDRDLVTGNGKKCQK